MNLVGHVFKSCVGQRDSMKNTSQRSSNRGKLINIANCYLYLSLKKY